MCVNKWQNSSFGGFLSFRCVLIRVLIWKISKDWIYYVLSEIFFSVVSSSSLFLVSKYYYHYRSINGNVRWLFFPLASVLYRNVLYDGSDFDRIEIKYYARLIWIKTIRVLLAENILIFCVVEKEKKPIIRVLRAALVLIFWSIFEDKVNCLREKVDLVRWNQEELAHTFEHRQMHRLTDGSLKYFLFVDFTFFSFFYFDAYKFKLWSQFCENHFIWTTAIFIETC